MKIEKISNYALYGVCALIVLIFAVCFIGPSDFDEKGNTVPFCIDLLLVLQYALGVATAVLMAWSLFKGVQNSKGVDEVAITGIKGSKIVLFTCILTIASLLVGAVLGIGEPDFYTNNGVKTEGYMVTMVDAFLWSMYILGLVAAILVVISATGVVKNEGKK